VLEAAVGTMMGGGYGDQGFGKGGGGGLTVVGPRGGGRRCGDVKFRVCGVKGCRAVRSVGFLLKKRGGERVCGWERCGGVWQVLVVVELCNELKCGLFQATGGREFEEGASGFACENSR